MDSEAFWNDRAQYYQESNENMTFPPTLTLANMLEIQKSQDIIEVACSSGVFTVHQLQNLTNAKTFTSVDVSQKMIELAKARKEAAGGINKEIKHEFVVGDAQGLSFMKDESVDTYISNLCIHLVTDQNKFLQEAKRILKKGGRIGLSVPTRHDSFLPLLFKSFMKAGWKSPVTKDPFALGEKDAMVKILQDNGFEVRFCWDDHFKLPIYEEADIDFRLNSPLGEAQGVFLTFDEEKKKEVRENIMMEFHEMRKSFVPFQARLLLIVAEKPL